MPLRAGVGHKHRTAVDPRRGKPAATNFRVLERFKCAGQSYSLIEAVPETGRTHQIRAHLTALGYPVAADALYGGVAISLPNVQTGDAVLLRRVGLHACSLKLAHPITGEPVLFEAPYPDDFSNTLLLLRKYS
jgi:23S rRNA-/tRNA-specific pseudouridylate synthase